MHDGYAHTVDALKRLLPDLYNEGYQVVSVSQMAKMHGCTLKNGKVYIATLLRLIVIPAIAYLICLGLKLELLAPMVLIITCMPCGLNTIVFPKLIGEDCKPGARLALITHVLSIATIPF